VTAPEPGEREVVDLVGAFRGAVAAAKARREARCPRCQGAGEIPAPGHTHRHEHDPERQMTPCPGCHGTGAR